MIGKSKRDSRKGKFEVSGSAGKSLGVL